MNPDTVFPRKYRYILTPNKDKGIHHFVQSVSVDYYQKSLDLEVIEVNDGSEVRDWILKMGEKDYNDDLILTAFDGIGSIIYVLRFKNTSAVWHNVEYNYKSSDVVTHKLGLEYLELEQATA